jgi:hypothetical protein
VVGVKVSEAISLEVSQAFDILESVFTFAIDEPKQDWFRRSAKTYEENLRLYRRLLHIERQHEEDLLRDALCDRSRSPVYVVGRRSSGKTSLCAVALYTLRDYFGPLVLRVDLKYPDPQYNVFVRQHPEFKGHFEIEWLRSRVDASLQKLIDGQLSKRGLNRYDLAVQACLDRNEDSTVDATVIDCRRQLKLLRDEEPSDDFDQWLVDARAASDARVIRLLAHLDSALSLEGRLRALSYLVKTRAGMVLIFFDNVEGFQQAVEAQGKYQLFRQLAWSFGEFGKVLYALRPSTASIPDLKADLRSPTAGALKRYWILIDNFQDVPDAVRDALAEDFDAKEPYHCRMILRRRFELATKFARMRSTPPHARVSENAWKIVRHCLLKALESRQFLDNAVALANEDMRQVGLHGIRIARMMFDMGVLARKEFESSNYLLDSVTVDTFFYYYCATTHSIQNPQVFAEQLFCPASWVKARASRTGAVTAYEPYLVLARTYRMASDSDSSGDGSVSVDRLVSDLEKCGLAPERVRRQLDFLCASPDFEHGFLESDRQYFGLQGAYLESEDVIRLRPRGKLILEEVGRKFQFLLGSLKRANYLVGGAEFWPDSSNFFSTACIGQVLKLICAIAELEIEVESKVAPGSGQYLQKFGLFRGDSSRRPQHWSQCLMDQSFGFLQQLADSGSLDRDLVHGYNQARSNFARSSAFVAGKSAREGWMQTDIDWRIYG